MPLSISTSGHLIVDATRCGVQNMQESERNCREKTTLATWPAGGETTEGRVQRELCSDGRAGASLVHRPDGIPFRIDKPTEPETVLLVTRGAKGDDVVRLAQVRKQLVEIIDFQLQPDRVLAAVTWDAPCLCSRADCQDLGGGGCKRGAAASVVTARPCFNEKAPRRMSSCDSRNVGRRACRT